MDLTTIQSQCRRLLSDLSETPSEYIDLVRGCRAAHKDVTQILRAHCELRFALRLLQEDLAGPTGLSLPDALMQFIPWLLQQCSTSNNCIQRLFESKINARPSEWTSVDQQHMNNERMSLDICNQGFIVVFEVNAFSRASNSSDADAIQTAIAATGDGLVHVKQLISALPSEHQIASEASAFELYYDGLWNYVNNANITSHDDPPPYSDSDKHGLPHPRPVSQPGSSMPPQWQESLSNGSDCDQEVLKQLGTLSGPSSNIVAATVSSGGIFIAAICESMDVLIWHLQGDNFTFALWTTFKASDASMDSISFVTRSAWPAPSLVMLHSSRNKIMDLYHITRKRFVFSRGCVDNPVLVEARVRDTVLFSWDKTIFLSTITAHGSIETEAKPLRTLDSKILSLSANGYYVSVLCSDGMAYIIPLNDFPRSKVAETNLVRWESVTDVLAPRIWSGELSSDPHVAFWAIRNLKGPDTTKYGRLTSWAWSSNGETGDYDAGKKAFTKIIPLAPSTKPELVPCFVSPKADCVVVFTGLALSVFRIKEGFACIHQLANVPIDAVSLKWVAFQDKTWFLGRGSDRVLRDLRMLLIKSRTRNETSAGNATWFAKIATSLLGAEPEVADLYTIHFSEN